MEYFRTHLAIKCAVLGLALVVVGALLSPGGDMEGATVNTTAAIVLTVVIYLVLRRQTRRAQD